MSRAVLIDRGLTLPASNLLIAACAKVHDLDLFHRDAHFDSLVPLLAEPDQALGSIALRLLDEAA